MLATTFAFAPSFSFRRAPARAGEIATRDVIAPRDLIVPDAAATAHRRVEAAAEVLPVYDWDTAAPERLAGEIRASFSKAREVETGGRRRAGLPSALRDAFDLPVGDEALVALAGLQFSSGIEERILGAGADLYRAGIVDNGLLLNESRDRGIVLRDGHTGRELRRKDLSEIVEYGSQTKNAVARRLAGSSLSGRI